MSLKKTPKKSANVEKIRPTIWMLLERDILSRYRSLTSTYRSSGPQAVTGAKVAAGGRRGHQKQWGTQEEKGRRWAGYLHACLREHKKQPSSTLTEIRKSVAKAEGVCLRTIEAHTRELRKLITR